MLIDKPPQIISNNTKRRPAVYLKENGKTKTKLVKFQGAHHSLDLSKKKTID